MKKILFALMFLCLTASPLLATYPYEFTVADKSEVVSNDTYSLDLMTGKVVDYLSFQAIYSTVTYATITATISTISSVLNTVPATQIYPAGFELLYTSTTYNGGSLTNNATYYALNSTLTTLQISTGTTNAIAVILGTGTVGSFALTPITVQSDSPYSFKWQVSNDKTNWYDISATSVTILGTTAPTNYFWDLGFTSYRHIRAKLTAGTYGAIKLKLIGYGKRVAP